MWLIKLKLSGALSRTEKKQTVLFGSVPIQGWGRGARAAEREGKTKRANPCRRFLLLGLCRVCKSLPRARACKTLLCNVSLK